MADTKFSDMAAASSVGASDYGPIIQAGVNKTATFTVQKTYWDGIYQALDSDLTALSGLSGTHDLYYRSGSGTWASVTIGGGLDFSGATLDTAIRTYINSSTADSADPSGFSTDTMIDGSVITVASGAFKAKGQYRCVFDMTKTAAGTAAPVIHVRIGTLGTTGDTSRMDFTFSAGTADADSGIFEVVITFRTVGSGTSAVIAGYCRAQHNLATTGLISDAVAWTIIGTTSAGFSTSSATKIGLSFNGGTSFAGTVLAAQATFTQ